MESATLLNQMLSRYSLSDYLPYLAYNEEHDCYIMESGIGILYECAALQFPSESDKDVIRSLFEAALMPATSIQFMMFASNNVDPHLDAYVLSRQNICGESFYTEAAEQRRRLYKKGATQNIIKGNVVKVRDFRLFVSMVIPCDSTPHGFSQCIEKNLEQYRGKLRATLSALNMAPEPVQPDKFIKLLMEILNPSHDLKDNNYDETVPLRDQLIYSDTETYIQADHLRIDKKYCQSMTVKQYPEDWSIAKNMNYVGSIMENAKQIGVPFIIVLNCEYPDSIKDTAKIQKQAMTAKYQSFGNFAKWFPKLTSRTNNFESLLNMLEDESLFYGYFNIFFFANTKKEMHDVNQSFQTLYRSMGIILQDDPFISLPLFLQALPMGYNPAIQTNVKRRSTRTTGIIAEMVPIYADWRGYGRPIIQLVSRRGQLQYLDNFANTSGAYSGVVVASSGAGKSFFVNDMTIGYLAHGAKIWTIDVGRSYEKLCDFVGGEFISFSTESDVCINPFTYVADISEEMPMIKSIIAQMASREPLDDLHMSFIEDSVREMYIKVGNDLTVTGVADYLSSQKDPRQKELGMRLYPYTTKGSYGKFFNGKSNIKTEGDYFVYEMEELKSKKDLQDVILLAMVYQIQQDMLKKDRQKLVIIDEAWDMLRGGNSTNFIETVYRRFRKLGGAGICITQSVNDFYGLPAGVAIIENSDYFYLLRQRPESIEALKKSQRVILNDGLYELLRSVHTDVGNYSEIFAYTPGGCTIGRLIVDRFTQLLYTTKVEEFTRVKHYKDQGMSMSQAINKVLEEENMINI